MGQGGLNGRSYWKAACPLPDERREKADVHSGNRVGGLYARRWWRAVRPLSGGDQCNQTFIQPTRDGSYALLLSRSARRLTILKAAVR